MPKYELLIPNRDFELDSISEVEEPLDQALIDVEAGEITGGAIGQGWYRIDIELGDPERGLEIVRRVAGALNLPLSTLVREVGTERGVLVRAE